MQIFYRIFFLSLINLGVLACSRPTDADSLRKLYPISGSKLEGSVENNQESFEELGERDSSLLWRREFVEHSSFEPEFRIFVSSSQGSDANDGLSADRPVQSLQRAVSIAQSRSLPDYEASFQLLLRSGDVFDGENLGDSSRTGNSIWTMKGRSLEAPILISYYGAGDRPVISPHGRSAIRFWGEAQNIIVKGIKFNPLSRDPNEASFDLYAPEFWGIEVMFGARNIRIEDCVFTNLTLGVYLSSGGGSLRPQDIMLFRNTFARSWANSMNNYQFRAFGVLGGGIRRVELVENSFIQNGWHPQIFTAIPTGYSHNVYLSGEAEDLVLERNWFLDAASMGVKMRSEGFYQFLNIRINDNIFAYNPIGLGLGVSDLPEALQYTDFEIKRNIITEGGELGALPPYGATNWGMTFGSGRNGVIEDNLIVQNPISINPQAIRLDAYPNQNVIFRSNIIHGFSGYSGILNQATEGVSMINNLVQTPTSGDSFVDSQYRFQSYVAELGLENKESFFDLLMNRPKAAWSSEYSTQTPRTRFRNAYSLPQ